MNFKGIKSAIWSEYLNQFFNHKISEIPLFLHIQQSTESSFTGCVSNMHLLPEWWSGNKSFILVPKFFRAVFPLTHTNWIIFHF